MRIFLKSIAVLIEGAAVIVLSLLFSLSIYAICDNNQVFSDAQTTQERMLQLKPNVGDGDNPPNFEDLQKVNPDVRGWISVDGTNIDYPILQGNSNLTYLNMDVYGNFSLAGSIFLDAANNSRFTDKYSLVYGHHMDNHMMFGDLDLFKNSDFFQKNRYATLLTKKEEVTMRVFAIMETGDSTKEIFHPTMWKKDLSKLVAYIKKHSMHVDKKAYEIAKNNSDSLHILALATCTDGATGNRAVLFLITDSKGILVANSPDEQKQLEQPNGINFFRPPAKTGDKLSNSPYFWFAIFVGSTMGLMILFTIRSRQL